MADQHLRTALHGADLAYWFRLQYVIDYRLRDDSGALFAGRRISVKIATRPIHKAVGIGASIYGIWLLYASGPMHLLLSVVLYARDCWFSFMPVKRTRMKTY